MTEREQRLEAVRVARTWKGTPFVWGMGIKGEGADCGRFLGGVFNEAGVKTIDMTAIKNPPPKWFLHKSSESYLDIIRQFATEYERQPGQKPQAGDIVVAEYGRDWAHAAIVAEWPCVIGCLFGYCVAEYQSIYRAPQYMDSRWKFFNPFTLVSPNVPKQ